MSKIKKAIHIIRTQGIQGFLKIFYEKHSHFLLSLELDSIPAIKEPNIKLEYLLITKENYKNYRQFLEQISGMMNENIKNLILKFQTGSECQIGINDGNVAGYIWLHFKRYKSIGFRYTLELDETSMYAGPDFVAEQYRGKRIHDALISRVFHAAFKQGRSRLFSSVTYQNISSIKGLKRSGYEPSELHHRTRIGPFIFYRKATDAEMRALAQKYYFGGDQ